MTKKKTATKKDITNWKKRIRKAYGKEVDPTVTVKRASYKLDASRLVEFIFDESGIKKFKQAIAFDSFEFDQYFDFYDYKPTEFFSLDDAITKVVVSLEKLRNKNLVIGTFGYDDPELFELCSVSDEELGELELKYQKVQEMRKDRQKVEAERKLVGSKLVGVQALFNKLLNQVGAEEVEKALLGILRDDQY